MERLKLKFMRSKEATNEYLEYIISSNSLDIDSLNLAKVSE